MPQPANDSRARIHPVDRLPALASAVMLTGIGALGFNVLPLLLGTAADVFGSDERRLGLLGFLFISGKTIMFIALIVAARRLNWRIACSVLCIVQCIAFLTATRVGDFALVAAALFIAGFCLGGLFGLGTISIADTREPDRNFGWATLAQVVAGAFLAYFLSTAIIPEWGFNGILTALAASALAGILLARGMASSGVTGPERTGNSSGSRIVPVAGLVGLVVFYLGVGAVWAFLERIALASGLTREFVGTAVSGALIAGGLSCLVPVLLADRIGRRWPIAISACGLCIAIAFFAANLAEAGFLATALTFNALWTIMAIYAIAVISVQDPTGWYVVAIPATLGIGQAIGPLAGGFTVANFGITGLCAMAVLMVLISLGIFFSITRERRKPEKSTGPVPGPANP